MKVSVDDGVTTPLAGARAPKWLSDKDELVGSRTGRLLYALLGRRLPKLILRQIVHRFEHGDQRSLTLRRFLWEHNGVDVGVHSYGSLLRPTNHRRDGLRIGRFVSISQSAKWGLNHPIDRIATSPAFYTSADDWSSELEIGHDAWIGEHVTVTPGCRRIGVGAVIGANSVVTSDIPDYAVAYGVPATVRRYRFSEETVAVLLNSRWWEHKKHRLSGRWPAGFSSPIASEAALDALRDLTAERCE